MKRVCHQFRDTGTCKYGPSCRFAHEYGNLAAAGNEANAASGVAELTAALGQHRPFASGGTSLGSFDVSSMPPAGEESTPDADAEAAAAASAQSAAAAATADLEREREQEGEQQAPLE